MNDSSSNTKKDEKPHFGGLAAMQEQQAQSDAFRQKRTEEMAHIQDDAKKSYDRLKKAAMATWDQKPEVDEVK